MWCCCGLYTLYTVPSLCYSNDVASFVNGIEHSPPLVKQLTFECKFTTIIFNLIQELLVLMPYMVMCISEDQSYM